MLLVDFYFKQKLAIRYFVHPCRTEVGHLALNDFIFIFATFLYSLISDYNSSGTMLENGCRLRRICH